MAVSGSQFMAVWQLVLSPVSPVRNFRCQFVGQPRTGSSVSVWSGSSFSLSLWPSSPLTGGSVRGRPLLCPFASYCPTAGLPFVNMLQAAVVFPSTVSTALCRQGRVCGGKEPHGTLPPSLHLHQYSASLLRQREWTN
ncbi:hypothetical protein ACOMHN_010831 [Nucella lapillus]